jgi:hypothetical protein
LEIQYQGELAGKQIATYRSTSRNVRHEDLTAYLRKFELCSALRFIGDLAYKNIFLDIQTVNINGVPTRDSILAYIAMLLIICSNDYKSKRMATLELIHAIDLYFGLPDPIISEEANIVSLLTRYGFSQFDYDRDVRIHQFSRTLIIYRDLWKDYNNEGIDIETKTIEAIGFDIEQTLTLGQYFFAGSREGYFHKIEDTSIFPDYLRKLTNPENQTKFLEWLSCSYTEFRHIYAEKTALLPSDEYEKSRFNPLINKPAIKIDRNINQGDAQIYVVPIPRLIYEKVTNGLYYSLTQSFSNNSHGNKFRAAFGNVFQQYVGLILRNAISHDLIQEEFRYRSNSNPKDTPDWIFRQGNTAIFIEVKQSCLYLDAKQWGNIDEVKTNLKKTIGAGVKQLFQFKEDIISNNYKNLNIFLPLEKIEFMIVTFDRAYFLNSFVREVIRELYPDIPTDFHWHTINIDEFETFISLAGSDLFEILQKKRLNTESDKIDFHEYCAQEFQERDFSNSFLTSIYKDWSLKVGLGE